MTRVCKRCGVSIEGHAKKNVYCSRSCQARISRNKRHGLSATREHATWLDMRNRCRNEKAHNYARYGGRGITICERWESFENFLADMGTKPKGYSIERNDNDGNYEPGNCGWATRIEQNKNKSDRYTAEQDDTIREGISRGLSFSEIGKLIDKSRCATSARAYRIGLSIGKRSADPVTSTERKTP
jgi:hypothetical protein